MFFFTKPDHGQIRQCLTAAHSAKFTYSLPGMTHEKKFPPGFTRDHNRVILGNGRDSFETAKGKIRKWKMFDLPWVEIHPKDAPILPGTNVAVVIEHLGFYSINPARIVYVIDEPDRFGFAYGTLEGHAEIGEERFSVEFNPVDGCVEYDLLAFSRPGHFLAKLGLPFARRLQQRFAADSLKAMRNI